MKNYFLNHDSALMSVNRPAGTRNSIPNTLSSNGNGFSHGNSGNTVTSQRCQCLSLLPCSKSVTVTTVTATPKGGKTLNHFPCTLTQCTPAAYAGPACPHDRSALASCSVTGAQDRLGLFLCVRFGFARFMVRLKGIPSGMPDTSYSGSPTPSVLPPYLAIDGRTSDDVTGVSHD